MGEQGERDNNPCNLTLYLI